MDEIPEGKETSELIRRVSLSVVDAIPKDVPMGIILQGITSALCMTATAVGISKDSLLTAVSDIYDNMKEHWEDQNGKVTKNDPSTGPN